MHGNNVNISSCSERIISGYPHTVNVSINVNNVCRVPGIRAWDNKSPCTARYDESPVRGPHWKHDDSRFGVVRKSNTRRSGSRARPTTCNPTMPRRGSEAAL